MNKYVFLYKVKDSDDRDCVNYIETKPMRFECDHYFGSVILHGACFSRHDFDNYDDIKTILSRNEYEQLIKFNKDINDLGYGIKKGDEKYLIGVELCKNIQPIFDKLNGEDNQRMFEEIIEEEKEYLMDEYGLDEDDIQDIFDNYGLDYRDRGVVSCIFKDSEDLGYEEAYSLGYINDNDSISSRYFDYEKFGEDLLEDERYLELSDGRVAVMNY